MDACRQRMAHRSIAPPCRCFPMAVVHGRVSLLPGGPLSLGSLIMIHHILDCLACQARESGRITEKDISITETIPPPGRSVFLQAFDMQFSRFVVIRREAKENRHLFFLMDSNAMIDSSIKAGSYPSMPPFCSMFCFKE